MAASTGQLSYSFINCQQFEYFKSHISILIQFPILKIKISIDGRKILNSLFQPSFIIYLNIFILNSNFLNPTLILCLNSDCLFKCVKLLIHPPNINFIGSSSHSECFANRYSLYGIIPIKTFFNNLKIIQKPTVIRIAVIQMYK